MAPSSSDSAWIEGYERLRRQAVTGSASVMPPWGLTLLIQRGVVAWWRARAMPQRMAATLPPVEPAAVAPRRSLVAVLANMILGAREARP